MAGSSSTLAETGTTVSQQELPPSLFKRTPSSASSRRGSSSRTRPAPLVVLDEDDPAFPKRFASSSSNASSLHNGRSAMTKGHSTEEQNRLLYALEAEEEVSRYPKHRSSAGAYSDNNHLCRPLSIRYRGNWRRCVHRALIYQTG